MFLSMVKQPALNLHPSTLARREFSTALGSSEGSETKDWVSIRQIIFSTAFAFAASATIVALFPSQNYLSSDSQPSPGNNGGNRGGGAAHASALYLADPPSDVEAARQEESDDRGDLPDKQGSDGQVATVPLIHDRRRVYDVSCTDKHYKCSRFCTNSALTSFLSSAKI